MEDCEPRTGYHRSRKNEIYRCETESELNGVLAFTEASGDTDYSCGFYEAFRPHTWGGIKRGYDAVYKVLNNFH